MFGRSKRWLIVLTLLCMVIDFASICYAQRGGGRGGTRGFTSGSQVFRGNGGRLGRSSNFVQNNRINNKVVGGNPTRTTSRTTFINNPVRSTTRFSNNPRFTQVFGGNRGRDRFFVNGGRDRFFVNGGRDRFFVNRGRNRFANNGLVFRNGRFVPAGRDTFIFDGRGGGGGEGGGGGGGDSVIVNNNDPNLVVFDDGDPDAVEVAVGQFSINGGGNLQCRTNQVVSRRKCRFCPGNRIKIVGQNGCKLCPANTKRNRGRNICQ